MPKPPPRKAPIAIGYDGNAPRAVKLRDLAGSGKRDLSVVMCLSRWHRLCIKGGIDSRQLQAIERLERDWHSSKLISYSSASTERGSTTSTGPQDSKLDAMLRKDRALDAISVKVSKQARRVVVLAVIDSVPLKQIGKACNIGRDKAIRLFREGLEVLVNHYG